MKIIINRPLETQALYRPRNRGNSSFKTPIAFVISVFVVIGIDFDAMAVIFSTDGSSTWGHFPTAAVIAGGSKGSLKLFKDVMDVKSQIQKDKEAAAKAAASGTGATP